MDRMKFIISNGKINRYNACTDSCDMYDGPCACGAWHYPDEPSGYKDLSMREMFNTLIDEEE